VESLLNRYRNITVLLLVIMAQLVLLAVSAKNDQDVRFIRLWTVTAVTPVARIVEGLRGGGTGFLHNYILLHDAHQENLRLRAELDRMKMENVFLKNELNTADRAKALQVFQQHTQSKTVAATIIATGAGSNSKVVFVDRGTTSGIQRGMAVVTPDGIVGKVIAAYPTASQVLLITDPDFAAGVVTEKAQVHGTLKGQGTPQCKIDYIPFEEKVEPGEWIYTSGDDRVFPRGFRVGVVKAVRPGQPFKEILVEPSGLQRGLVEDVLILIEGVHQAIPEAPSGPQPIYMTPPVPGSESQSDAAVPSSLGTEADRLRTQYKSLGEEQKHTYGDNPPGTKPMDFTRLGSQGGATGQAGPTAPAPAPGRGAVPAVTKPPVTPSAAPQRTVPAGPSAAPSKNPPTGPGTPPSATPTRAVPAGQIPAPPKNSTTGSPSTDPATAPSRVPAGPVSVPTKNSPTGTPPAAPDARDSRTTPGGQSPAPTKNSPPPSGTPTKNTFPAVGPPAAPPKSVPAGPSSTPSSPSKNSPPPSGTPAKPPSDATRRINQSAGGPPGGQPR
jgi:rod shape-determining protein MreC